MSKMTEAYQEAMKKSYSNQKGGITIPAEELNKMVTILMGTQPLGICARPHPNGGDEVVIAFYFEPAICLALVTRDEKGLHFKVSHIRGVNHGIQSVRLFPDVYQPGGANRAHCVLWGPDDKTIWVSRNGERDFFVLSPPNKPGGRWTLTAKLPLPPNSDMGELHSTVMVNTKLVTIESRTDLTNWCLCQYDLSTENIKVLEESIPVPDWTYGIAFIKDMLPLTITDFRCVNRPRGIFCVTEQIVSDVWGNGIAFLSDGSMLVTVYGQSESGPFNGSPGRLIYIPSSTFSHI